MVKKKFNMGLVLIIIIIVLFLNTTKDIGTQSLITSNSISGETSSYKDHSHNYIVDESGNGETSFDSGRFIENTPDITNHNHIISDSIVSTEEGHNHIID